MKASRFGELARASVPAGQSSRWTESSTMDSSTRRSKGSSTSTSTLKRKMSCGPSTYSGTPSPSPSSRNKCPPRLHAKGHAVAAEDSFVYATANSDIHPYPSDYEQVTILPNIAECPWPNWPDWGSENHSERGRAGSPIGPRSYSETSSSCSHSDSESNSLWSTSSSSGSRVHESGQRRKTRSFWEDLIWGERRPWGKLRQPTSFLKNLWDFKSETKVEESCDPILVSVNVLESPGPLRLVVDKNDSVQHTIDFVLRRYAAQKREPTLVDPIPFFGLYCRNPDFEALDDEARIGHRSARQFHIYHRHRKDLAMEDIDIDEASSCKSNGTTTSTAIKTWIWNSLDGMRSLAGHMGTGILQTLTFWVKYLNPRRFYRFIYIAAKKALSLRVG